MKKCHVSSTNYVLLDNFIENETESKTHAEKNKSKLCVHIHATEAGIYTCQSNKMV